MESQNRFFRASSRIFERYRNDFSASEKFNGVTKYFDSLLLIGDRLLVAMEREGSFEILSSNVRACFDDLSKHGIDPDQAGYKLLVEVLEGLAKGILRFSNPSSFNEASEKGARFNLYELYQRLGLIDLKELESVPSDNQLDHLDPIEICILDSKQFRNEFAHFNNLPAFVRDKLPGCALVTILSILYLHRTALQKNLSGLIVRDLNLEEEDRGPIGLLREEFFQLTKTFGGRGNELKMLADAEIQGGWHLVRGEAGVGKSALLANFILKFVNEKNVIGSEIFSDLKGWPWLPSVLFYSGKCGGRSDSAVNRLIAQANTRLLDPLHLVKRDSTFRPEEIAGTASQELTLEEALRSKQKNDSYHSELFNCLDRLAAETGEALLIIDAFDEFNDQKAFASILPQVLPENVSIIITTRTGEGDDILLDRNISAEMHDIDRLSRMDIQHITHLPDSNSSHKEFNDLVMSHTDGYPQIVKSIGDAVLVNNGECLSEMELREKFSSLDQYFKLRKEKWDTPLLKTILPILCILEPVTYLHPKFLALLFTLKKKTDFEQGEAIEELKKVSSDLIIEDGDSYKLRVRLFAEYVLNSLSETEKQELLSSVWNCLTSLSEIFANLITNFISAWAISPRANNLINNSQDFVFEQLIKKIARPRKGKSELGWCLRNLSEEEINHPFTLKCIEYGADEHDLNCAFVLGACLMNGHIIERNEERGLKYLEFAASQNHLESIEFLASSYIWATAYTILPRNRSKGIGLLRKAVQLNSEAAKILLAKALCESSEIKEQNEGEEIFHKECSAGNPEACLQLGLRYRNFSKAKQSCEYFEKAVKAGSDLASIYLGQTLFNYDIDKKLGIRILESYDQTEYEGFHSYILGNIYLNEKEGDGYKDKATKKLKTASLYPNYRMESLKSLLRCVSPKAALEFIASSDFGSDIQLARFAVANSILSKKDAKDFYKDALQILREESEAGSNEATFSLGIRLFEGDNIEKNVTEGLQLLEMAALDNNLDAINYLATEYHYGEEEIEQNLDRAVLLYEQATTIIKNDSRPFGSLYEIYSGKEDESNSEWLQGIPNSEQLAFDWLWKGVFYESTLPAMPKAIHHGCIDEFKEQFLILCKDYFYRSKEYKELCEDGGIPEELSNAIKSAFKESFETNFADNFDDKISKHLFRFNYQCLSRLKEAAEKGNPWAYEMLGDLYCECSVLKEEKKAIQYYEKSGELGRVEALGNLAERLILFGGEIGECDAYFNDRESTSEYRGLSAQPTKAIQIYESLFYRCNNKSPEIDRVLLTYAKRLLEGDLLAENKSKGMQVLTEIVGFGDFSGPRNNPHYSHKIEFLQRLADDSSLKDESLLEEAFATWLPFSSFQIKSLYADWIVRNRSCNDMVKDFEKNLRRVCEDSINSDKQIFHRLNEALYIELWIEFQDFFSADFAKTCLGILENNENFPTFMLVRIFGLHRKAKYFTDKSLYELPEKIDTAKDDFWEKILLKIKVFKGLEISLKIETAKYFNEIGYLISGLLYASNALIDLESRDSDYWLKSITEELPEVEIPKWFISKIKEIE